MSDIAEDEWREAMTKIFDLLSDDQYKKMLGTLQKSDFSSPQKKTAKFKKDLPQRIIEMYGVEESIAIIRKAMTEIPRNDPSVQSLLRPFVDKLGRKQEEKPADEPKSSAPEQERKIPAMAIRDLKTTGVLGQSFIAGKVVKKSVLRTYQTMNNVTKPYFHLGVADKTDYIKVMVYGRERFQDIQEGSFYTFREVLMENDLMKITQMSKISETASFDVPKSLDLEALKLLSSPVSSIANVQTTEANTLVSVEGTVKEIGCCQPIELRSKQMKKDKLDFKLEDDTGSIRISLWGEDTEHLRGISVGDFITVINVKTNIFRNIVSLNSTRLNSTRIIKVRSAAVHNVTIQIVGIMKAEEVESELEALVNNQPQALVVASSLLRNMLSISQESNLKDELVKKIPFWAEAEIQGNKIKQIKVTQQA